MQYQTGFQPDKIAASAFIAAGVQIVGDVTIGERASVWFNSVLRGDCEKIAVGDDANIQDLSVVHADPGFPCLIGDRVTVGHAALLHGAVIEEDVLIGMRSVVMNGARIGTGSVIGAATLITEGVVIPPNSLVLGSPGKGHTRSAREGPPSH